MRKRAMDYYVQYMIHPGGEVHVQSQHSGKGRKLQGRIIDYLGITAAHAASRWQN